MNAPRFNHLAIAVNVALQFVLGTIWYGGIFAQAWLTGLERDQAMVMRNGPTPYMLAIVAAAAMGYGLSWLLQQARAESMSDALKIGLLLGVVFTALPLAMHHAFAGYSWQLAAIDTGNRMVGILLATVLLTLWKPKAQAPVKPAAVVGSVRSRAA